MHSNDLYVLRKLLFAFRPFYAGLFVRSHVKAWKFNTVNLREPYFNYSRFNQGKELFLWPCPSRKLPKVKI